MADERIYIVPLRKEWLKVARYRRSKKAVSALRLFIQKHMKSEDVRLGRHLNMKLWSRGTKHPPHKVAVKAVKVEDKDSSYVKVELVGAPEEKVPEKKKKDLATRLREKVTGKEEKPKAEKAVKKEKKVSEEPVKEEQVVAKKEVSKVKEEKKDN